MVTKFHTIKDGRVMIIRKNMPFVIVKSMTYAYAYSLSRGWLK